MVFDIWTIVLLVLLVLGIILGAVQGFSKQIKFLFGFVGALIAAILLFKLVYLMLRGFGLEASIAGGIEPKLIAKNDAFAQVVEESTYADVLTNLLSSIKIPEFISSLVIKKLPYNEAYAGMTYGAVAAQGLARLIVNSIAFISVLIIAWIALAIVYKLIKKIFEVNLLKPVNVLLGVAVGALKVALLVCAVMWGLSLLSGVPAIAPTIAKILPKEPESGFSFGYWVYSNNPLVFIIGKLF